MVFFRYKYEDKGEPKRWRAILIFVFAFLYDTFLYLGDNKYFGDLTFSYVIKVVSIETYIIYFGEILIKRKSIDQIKYEEERRNKDHKICAFFISHFQK